MKFFKNNSENSRLDTRKPRKDFIYLVYAPNLVYWSAGIQVLHKLKSGIEDAGYETYLINHGLINFKKKLEMFRTIKALNKRDNKVLVAIYPETIIHNPIGVNHQIRWLLNTPGLLGGLTKFDNETVWAYSKLLSEEYYHNTKFEPNVLFIPSLDLSEFDLLTSQLDQAKKKDKEVIYAQKFRALGGLPDIGSKGFVEITRFGRGATSRIETLKVLKEAKCLHVYENSTIITEAQLLGIPVYCHESTSFSFLIAKHELGDEGVSWSQSVRPKPNPQLIRRRLEFHEKNYKIQIKNLIEEYQSQDKFDVDSKISLNPFTLSFEHKFLRFLTLLKTKGPSNAFRFLRIYFQSLLMK
jgi:hypothetical protein